jgi:NTE family protein
MVLAKMFKSFFGDQTHRVGLALGGGAAMGAAHVGVLRAIDELNIKIDYISGTSIGGVVGAFYAFGMNWEKISVIASQLRWIDVTSVALSRYGLLSHEKIKNLIVRHLGDVNLEDARIPLAMTATDATSGAKVVLDKGSVITAVLATTCVPGIFKPVVSGDKMLLDGGIVENVPVDTVRAMGADYVIAVDLHTKQKFAKPKDILDVLFNSYNFIRRTSAELQTRETDILIQPDLSDFNLTDTSRIAELQEAGYSAALDLLMRR